MILIEPLSELDNGALLDKIRDYAFQIYSEPLNNRPQAVQIILLASKLNYRFKNTPDVQNVLTQIRLDAQQIIADADVWASTPKADAILKNVCALEEHPTLQANLNQRTDGHGCTD